MNRFGWVFLVVPFFLTSCDQKISEVIPFVKNQERLRSDKAKKAKANAQILYEIYRVVLVRDPKSNAEFGGLVDTLNQGASLEGIYNGLTHSSEYRLLEQTNPGSQSKALSVFSEELAHLAFQFETMPQYTEKNAAPLPEPTEVGLDAIPREVIFRKKRATPKTPSEYAKRIQEDFKGASIYTLKRVLSDEILKLMDEKKSKNQLTTWYLDWIEHVSRHSVGFGLKERDQMNRSFHESWVKKTSIDKMKWEVLNRVHRLLNHFQSN